MILLKKLTSTTHGVDWKPLLRIHHAIIRSKWDHKVAIYVSAESNILNKLNPIHHHTAIRIANDVFRISPTVSLLSKAAKLALNPRKEKVIPNLRVHLTGFNDLTAAQPYMTLVILLTLLLVITRKKFFQHYSASYHR